MTRMPRPKDLSKSSATSRPSSLRGDRVKPLIYGGVMVAIGALLLRSKPSFGEVPQQDLNGEISSKRKRRRAASFARDRAASFAPSNVTDQIGKSLAVGGAAMIVARILDELAGRDD